MVNILDHLPPVITDIREIQYLGVAENPELNALYRALDELMNNQFVDSSTEIGVKRWERILGLKPNSSATLEERKFQILNILNVKLPYTFRMLKNRLQSLYGDAYTISLVSDTSTLHVGIPASESKSLQSTKDMLEVICPANVKLEIKVI